MKQTDFLGLMGQIWLAASVSGGGLPGQFVALLFGIAVVGFSIYLATKETP